METNKLIDILMDSGIAGNPGEAQDVISLYQLDGLDAADVWDKLTDPEQLVGLGYDGAQIEARVRRLTDVMIKYGEVPSR